MESGGSYTLSANTKYYLIGVDEVSSLFSTYASGNAWTLSTSGEVSIGGNINTLLGNASLDTLDPYAFHFLFYDCSSLVDANGLELPATTLADSCYGGMFYNCTALTEAPELPAMEIPSSAYYSMFRGCTSLTKAPDLPATSFTGTSSYAYMFYGCTNLTDVPEILPATELTISCYQYMFYECSSLTRAPELPATTLVTQCYRYMFSQCASLNYIKCLATDRSAARCTMYWVNDVGTEGTFVCSADASWGSGIDGIPSGWTVEYI